MAPLLPPSFLETLMLPQPATAPQQAAADFTTIGVGIDTSRYGHYAAFVRHDLQQAADELQFVESAAGYAQFRARLQQIVARHGNVHFNVRLDAAGQYADNLLHFLHALAASFHVTISCGDPQRNKNYRAALFGGKKSDPVEARAAARYAVTERPASVKVLPAELRTLRQVAGRLQAVVRQRTRLINQFHHLLALTFPELALLVKDISSGWVLELCSRYPTAKQLATASAADIGQIPYLPDKQIDALLEHARNSIASLEGDTVAELVRDQVRQLRDVSARQKRLENTLQDAYRRLPEPNHLDTIPGFGEVTAAILTAFILDIDRFETPNQLVAYFGAMPIEVGSGVDRDGKARPAKRYVMCRRGNDLVRRYLWMAALSAVRFNPAVRALYARVVAKHPQRKAIAIGHAMRKLLHLAFAIWKSNKPFDKSHYPWDTPAHVELSDAPDTPKTEQAAGLKRTAEPARKEVATTCPETLPANEPPDESSFIDFAHVKKQLPMTRVFEHLGLSARLNGPGAQKRCACPIHRADGRGRTFSVNLHDNVFHCFDAQCQKKGDVIDLWAALHQMELRHAALDLVRTFALEPAPAKRTEKRHG
jgi:transposase